MTLLRKGLHPSGDLVNPSMRRVKAAERAWPGAHRVLATAVFGTIVVIVLLAMASW